MADIITLVLLSLALVESIWTLVLLVIAQRKQAHWQQRLQELLSK